MIKTTVTKLGFKGDGSVIIDDVEYFVPYVIEGEEVEVEIDNNQKDRAILKSIIKKSDKRIEPICPLFTVCGACKLQHVSNYQDFKKEYLLKTLKPLCPENIKINDFTFIGHNTRRRALFNLVDGKLGFFKEKSNDIVEVKSCPLLRNEINNFISGMEFPNITATVVVTLVNNGIDVNISSKKPIECTKKLSNVFKKALRLTINEVEIFNKEKPLIEFDGIKIPFPAGSFLQPSVDGEMALKASVMKFVPPEKKIADIFCGMGTFTVPLSKISKEVHGFEAFRLGVKALNDLKIKNIKAFERDLFKNPLTAKELDSFDVIVMDPPRTGATAISQNFKNTKKINQIVYISCNPSTFVRDAKYITEAGFKIVEIDVVDQFTYTHHLELIANIVRA